MNRKQFGKLVRSMRRQRTFFDKNQNYKLWTREYLASKSGLTQRQIIGIEQGQVVNLYPSLEGLASAFELGELEKVEFYGEAGYVYVPKRQVINWDNIEKTLGQVQYPAYARTPLWDFVAVNTLNMRLWGQDNLEIRKLFYEKPLGANMLRVNFDPRFNHKARKGGEYGWYKDAQHCITSFRMMAFKFGHTKRYRVILNEMNKFPEFVRHWDLSRQMPVADFLDVSPLLNVYHPKYGHMSFISSRIPTYYSSNNLEIAIYIPTSSSEISFQKLRNDVQENSVILFRDVFLV